MAGRHSVGVEPAQPESEITADFDIQNSAPAQYTAPVETREPSGDGPAQWVEADAS